VFLNYEIAKKLFPEPVKGFTYPSSLPRHKLSRVVEATTQPWRFI